MMVAVAMLVVPAAASAQGVDTTCSFALTRLDATTTNALAVDTGAVYWGGTYAALPGTRIRIEGQYPHARYISWNVYDAAARPIDALSDVELAPDAGSSNPFLPGAYRTVTVTPRHATAASGMMILSNFRLTLASCARSSGSARIRMMTASELELSRSRLSSRNVI